MELYRIQKSEVRSQKPEQDGVYFLSVKVFYSDFWLLTSVFCNLTPLPETPLPILALDTSTERCSAALHCGGTTIFREELAPRRHGQLILPMVEQLLAEAECKLGGLDAIAFGRGPGAFTGVRLATSVAQGLAFAVDVPLIPVSSLAVLAQAVTGKADYIAAVMDARMGEVYFGLFRSGAVVAHAGAETVSAPAAISLTTAAPCFGVGSGWGCYASILREKCGANLAGYEAGYYPQDRKSTRLNSSHMSESRMPSSA